MPYFEFFIETCRAVFYWKEAYPMRLLLSGILNQLSIQSRRVEFYLIFSVTEVQLALFTNNNAADDCVIFVFLIWEKEYIRREKG